MILLTPLALIGLVFLPLLIVLHLRRRRYRLEEVSSTRLWRELLDEMRPKPSLMRLHTLPLLLLQLLAVALLVVGLARPASLAAPSQQRRQQRLPQCVCPALPGRGSPGHGRCPGSSTRERSGGAAAHGCRRWAPGPPCPPAAC